MLKGTCLFKIIMCPQIGSHTCITHENTCKMVSELANEWITHNTQVKGITEWTGML